MAIFMVYKRGVILTTYESWDDPPSAPPSFFHHRSVIGETLPASSFTFAIFSFASLSLAHDGGETKIKKYRHTGGWHTWKWKWKCWKFVGMYSKQFKRNVSHADQLKETDWCFVNVKKLTANNNLWCCWCSIKWMDWNLQNKLYLFCLFSQLQLCEFLWMETAVSSAHIKVISWVVSPNSFLPSLFRIIGRRHL